MQLADKMSANYGSGSGSAAATSPAVPGAPHNGGEVVGPRAPLVPQAAIQTLASLAQDFIELSHTCLLVLHLEVMHTIVLKVYVT